MNYKDSGVDIEVGNAFVEELKKKAPSIGGFGGMFELPSGYYGEDDDGQLITPVLVSGTDGVGTKINICRVANDYTTIGIDLVAMCVNDVITSGAKPLYFLDYISTQKIDDNVADIMVGILKGCEIAGVELIGGETAEHFRQRDYDLAGFCTGVVRKNWITRYDGTLIKPGDKIVGLASSGLHSNGYTLINDMLWRHKIAWADTPELLTPTTIYVKQVEKIMDEHPITGMAHITGGGLEENINRIIPEGFKAQIDWSSWERPEIFNKIQKAGEIEEDEMRRVFNCGIGFCVVAPPEFKNDDGLIIGEVVTCD